MTTAADVHIHGWLGSTTENTRYKAQNDANHNHLRSSTRDSWIGFDKRCNISKDLHKASEDAIQGCGFITPIILAIICTA